MSACDVVVTKAGPGTIMEAVALGKPLILTGAVGLQEEGNIGFVTEAQLGVFCPNPVQAALATAVMLSAQASRDPASVTIPAYAGTAAIADTLLSLLPRQTGATDKSKTGEVVDAHS